MSLVEQRLFGWPPGFRRVPEEAWTQRTASSEGLRYAGLTNQLWYSNLDYTVHQLREHLGDGDLIVDYSAGTGILYERWQQQPGAEVGWILVDASPRFLQVAVEKLWAHPLVAFRLLSFLKDQHRLEFLDEALPGAIRGRGVDAIVCTNAVHLYPNLPQTFAGWARALRRGGRVFVQSGNMWNGQAEEGAWIIEDTVEAIHRFAVSEVTNEARYARYRPALEDLTRMAAHQALRHRYFLPPRHVDEYVVGLCSVGLRLERAVARSVEVSTAEWAKALEIYAEGILGWIGGVEKIDGRTATDEDRKARSELIERGLQRYFGNRPLTKASWTYITCRKE
jgi:SAM-dependent methyltransferase